MLFKDKYRCYCYVALHNNSDRIFSSTTSSHIQTSVRKHIHIAISIFVYVLQSLFENDEDWLKIH